MAQVTTEAPTGPRSPRILLWVTAAVLIAANLYLDYLEPACRIRAQNGFQGCTVLGTVLAQPYLIAFVALFWPSRPFLRWTIVLGFLLPAVSWMNMGMGGRNSVDEMFFHLSAFLVGLLAFAIVRRWRGWRIVLSAEQFNLREMFIVTTLLCILAAMGIAGKLDHLPKLSDFEGPHIVWPHSIAEIQFGLASLWRSEALIHLMILPIVLCLPAALGSGRRFLALAAAVFAGLLVTYYVIVTVGSGEANKSVVTGIFFGGAGASLGTMLMLRLCGFRLVKT